MDYSSYHPGDVVLFAGKSWLSRGIKLFSASKYSHAGIYIGEGRIVEATNAGVENNILTFKNCSAYCIRRRPGTTVAEAYEMVAEAKRWIHDGYDYAQLLTLGVYFFLRWVGITWPAIVDNMPNRMICSELVAKCYLAIGVKFNKRLKLVTPEMLYVTTELETIEEVEYK